MIGNSLQLVIAILLKAKPHYHFSHFMIQVSPVFSSFMKNSNTFFENIFYKTTFFFCFAHFLPEVIFGQNTK